MLSDLDFYKEELDRTIDFIDYYVSLMIKDEYLKIYADKVNFHGKHIRSILGILTAKLFNLKLEDNLLKILALLEISHTASLVVDDIIDKASLRRGKKTLNILYSNNTAMLFGIYLIPFIFKHLGDINCEISTYIADNLKQLPRAELIVDRFLYDLSISEKDYFQIITGKTAILFSTIMGSVSLYYKSLGKYKLDLENIGLNIGLAFQIVDDILDYKGNVKDLKKPVLEDIKTGKYTLPLIYVLNKIDEKEKKLFLQKVKLLKDNLEDKELVNEIIKFIEKYKGFEYSRDIANNYLTEVRKILFKFKNINETAEMIFDMIIDFIKNRNN